MNTSHAPVAVSEGRFFSSFANVHAVWCSGWAFIPGLFGSREQPFLEVGLCRGTVGTSSRISGGWLPLFFSADEPDLLYSAHVSF